VNRRQFEKYLALYQGTITAIARKLAGRDDDLVEDLEQEGRVALLFLDPGMARTNLDSMIRQAAHFRMIDFLRRLNPQQYDSLDAMLLNGCQLERDAYGDPHLVSLVQRTFVHRELEKIEDDEDLEA